MCANAIDGTDDGHWNNNQNEAPASNMKAQQGVWAQMSWEESSDREKLLAVIRSHVFIKENGASWRKEVNVLRISLASGYAEGPQWGQEGWADLITISWAVAFKG